MDKKIDGWIEAHQQELIDTVAGAVRIPSVLAEEKAGAPFGVEIGRALSFFLAQGRRMEMVGFS